MIAMAEASMAAFGSAIGVAIALAVVTFALRGKGHPEPMDQLKEKFPFTIFFLLVKTNQAFD